MKKNQILRSLLATAFAFTLLTISVDASDRDEAAERSHSIEQTYRLNERQPLPFDAQSGLENYLAYAALNNPGLKAAFYRWRAALEKEGVVDALPDPKFTYAYFVENVETRVGPQNQRLSIRQMFPWFGTLGARGDMAFEAAKAAYQNYQATKLRLFYKVKSAYSDYWYLGREIQLTRENMELLGFWESVVRTKYEAAQKKHHDVIKAQVELGKLDDMLQTLESMKKPVAARLRAALNLPDSVQLPLPQNEPESGGSVDRDSTLAQAVAYNPDLRALEHLIDKERAGVRLANKGWFPNFTFGVDYVETGEAVNPLLEESGKDPWIASVGINLPIWFGKNKSRQDEAKANFRAAQYKLSDARNRIIELTEKVLFEYEDARRKIRLYRDGLVPKAEQSLNATYAAYQSGESDFLNVLDAQRLLLNFQLMLDRARRDLASRKAELEMITGHEMDE